MFHIVLPLPDAEIIGTTIQFKDKTGKIKKKFNLDKDAVTKAYYLQNDLTKPTQESLYPLPENI